MNWLSIAVVLLAVSLARTDPIDKSENARRIKDCGKKIQSKVYRGRTAQQTESPWSVLIQIRESSSMGICTGTIVSPRHIITATHCFFGPMTDERGFQDMKLVQRNDKNCDGDKHYVIKDEKLLKAMSILSEGSKGPVISSYPEKVTLVKACQPKPSVTKDTAPRVYDDFAIIHLYEDLKFSSTVNLACVPTNEDGQDDDVVLQYYGFGNDHVNNERADDPEGEDKTGTLRHEEIQVMGGVPGFGPHLFVARDPQKKTVACPGDSGGGSWRKDPDNENRATVIGVLSQTTCDADGGRWGDPAKTVEVYTSVVFHLESLCKNTGICKDDAEHNANLSGYVKKQKLPRTTAAPNGPKVQKGDDGGSENNEDPNTSESEQQHQNEPDGAHQNSPVLFFAIFMIFWL